MSIFLSFYYGSRSHNESIISSKSHHYQDSSVRLLKISIVPCTIIPRRYDEIRVNQSNLNCVGDSEHAGMALPDMPYALIREPDFVSLIISIDKHCHTSGLGNTLFLVVFECAGVALWETKFPSLQ